MAKDVSVSGGLTEKKTRKKLFEWLRSNSKRLKVERCGNSDPSVK